MTFVEVDFDTWQQAAISGIEEAAESLNDVSKEYVYSLLES